MNSAQSNENDVYADAFRKAFLRLNQGYMEHNKFHCDYTVDISHRTIASFTVTENIKLKDLFKFAEQCSINDPELLLYANTQVFFETTAQLGNKLLRTRKDKGVCNIRQIVEFYKMLQEDNSMHMRPINNATIVLVYNGADSVLVRKLFLTQCSAVGLRGNTVFLPSTAMSEWDARITEYQNKACIQTFIDSVMLLPGGYEKEELLRSALALKNCCFPDTPSHSVIGDSIEATFPDHLVTKSSTVMARFTATNSHIRWSDDVSNAETEFQSDEPRGKRRNTNTTLLCSDSATSCGVVGVGTRCNEPSANTFPITATKTPACPTLSATAAVTHIRWSEDGVC